MPRNVLLLFHCASNTGYAIATLERIFHQAARNVAGEDGAVHYAYSDLAQGRPKHLENERADVIQVKYAASPVELRAFETWVRRRMITHVLAFDLPVDAPVTRTLRSAGVKRIVSYWGASISDTYPWFLRPLRRVQYLLTFSRPDHFVFESRGMRNRAILGAGIPARQTSVCNIGVDCDLFRPSVGSDYAHRQFDIPRHRHIVFFSGHMEERKGVHVLIDAFLSLPSSVRERLHLVLAGNTREDAQRLSLRFGDDKAAAQVTFAGYRNDIPLLQQSASIGVIASTGWDSFTVSAVEMAATGLPLVVSDLPGLQEAVIPGETGLRVPPGDTAALAAAISSLALDHLKRSQYGAAARERAVAQFSAERQIREVTGHLLGC